MRCFYCYKPLAENEQDFHALCSKRMFGQAILLVLPYAEAELEKLAHEVEKGQTTVDGGQAKLLHHLASEEHRNTTKKFTIVGVWGGYILNLPTPNYPQLPEVEDLTMYLARLAKISVVPHSLICLRSDGLYYQTY